MAMHFDPLTEQARQTFALNPDSTGNYSRSCTGTHSHTDCHNSASAVFAQAGLAALEEALAAATTSRLRTVYTKFATAIEPFDQKVAADIRRCGLPLKLCIQPSGNGVGLAGYPFRCGRRVCPSCSFQTGNDNARAFRHRIVHALECGFSAEVVVLTTSEVGITDPAVAKDLLAKANSLLASVYHRHIADTAYGLIAAWEPHIDADGLFRPHIHAIVLGRQGSAARLARAWNKTCRGGSAQCEGLGHAEALNRPIDAESLLEALSQNRIPRRLAYHLKTRRIRKPANATDAEIRAFAESVAVFRGTQMIRAFGQMRRKGGRLDRPTRNGIERPRPSGAKVCPPPPGEPPVAPVTEPAPPSAMAAVDAGQRTPVPTQRRQTLSEAVLLRGWYLGPRLFEPVEPGAEPQALPFEIGSLQDFVFALRHPVDPRFSRLAGAVVTAAARLINNSLTTTREDFHFQPFTAGELAAFRHAGYDPNLRPWKPFDDEDCAVEPAALIENPPHAATLPETT